MNMNQTPSAQRIHIGIFGKRNAGKSSIINALTGQNLAIVSNIPGTTTDPVSKTMELLPLGPVIMIDTPGLDDTGKLGSLRVQKAYQMLNKTDIALLITDGTIGITDEDLQILERIRSKHIPYLIVLNKSDLVENRNIAETELLSHQLTNESFLWASAASGENIHELKERLGTLTQQPEASRKIVSDLIQPSDFIILVVPLDKSAPKGRLILPQQQTIRDILDAGAVAIVTKDSDLADTLQNLGKPPALVITDSQVFQTVSANVPEEIPLTSFSILFARYKGNLATLVHGVRMLDNLKEHDKILISEGCTHHRQCNDIGTVKLPNWIQKYSGKKLDFEFTSGTEFPADLKKYKLIVHCGGCMLTERELSYRLKCAEDANVPITNYGTVIAYIHGILERSIQIFQDI